MVAATARHDRARLSELHDPRASRITDNRRPTEAPPVGPYGGQSVAGPLRDESALKFPEHPVDGWWHIAPTRPARNTR